MAQGSRSNTAAAKAQIPAKKLVEFGFTLPNQPGKETLYCYIPGDYDGIGETVGWLWEAIEAGAEFYIGCGDEIRTAILKTKAS